MFFPRRTIFLLSFPYLILFDCCQVLVGCVSSVTRCSMPIMMQTGVFHTHTLEHIVNYAFTRSISQLHINHRSSASGLLRRHSTRNVFLSHQTQLLHPCINSFLCVRLCVSFIWFTLICCLLCFFFPFFSYMLFIHHPLSLYVFNVRIYL